MSQTQRNASNPAFSTWLTAHAGTGKTKVLVDRVLRLLLMGEVPSSILCITYTKAAAMEMQLRIRNRLHDWVRADELALHKELGDLLETAISHDHIQRARSLLCRLMEDQNGVQVVTIHAFCQSILARFPIEAGVAPHFQLLDDRSSFELLQEAKQRLLIKASAPATSPELRQAIAYVACAMGDQSFQSLMDELLSHHLSLSAMLRKPSVPIRVTTQIYDMVGLSYGVTAQALFDQGLSYTPELLDALCEACVILKAGSSNMQKLGEGLSLWLEQGPSVERFDAYSGYFLTDKEAPYKIPSFYTAALPKKRPDLAAILDQEQTRVHHLYHQLKAYEMARFSQEVLVIAQGIIAIYRTLKEERSRIDYDDVIAHTLGLLAEEGMAAWVMSKMDQRCRHMMLDEAQDTSPHQWMLTQRLVEGFVMDSAHESGLRSMFVVGDEKQSIYRFQGAAPEQFQLSQRAYEQYFVQCGVAFQSLRLDRSYRSTRAVLSVVDSTLAVNGLLEVDGKPIVHDVHRQDDAGCVELWPLIEIAEAQQRVAWSVQQPDYMQISPANVLCDAIVSRISQWLSSGRVLASKERAITPGDILILLRNRRPMAPLLITKLKHAGIAVAGADRLMLNEHLAVQDIVSMAQWCLLTSDDLALAEVLKGPWFGLDDEALFALAHDRQYASLWQYLQHQGHAACNRLMQIRDKAFALPPHEWLIYLMDELGGRAQCKAWFGDEIDELFDELLAQALQFESAHVPTLQSFVSWLLASDNAIKREMEQAGSAVRVMTVHGAKGLQAPIVIVPAPASKRPIHPHIWLTGDAPDQWVMLSAPTGVKSPVIQALKDQKTQMDREEEQRLLYVAMTRAQDELYVCTSTPSDDLDREHWYEQVKAGIMALPDHQILPDGTLRIECPQKVPVEVKQSSDVQETLRAVPSWFNQSAKAETAMIIRRPSEGLRSGQYHASSEMMDDSEQARLRGTLLHALLEYMPNAADHTSRELLRKLLVLRAPDPLDINVEALIDEALRIRADPQFGSLFSRQAQAEVSIAGSIALSNGQRVAFSGQIDRLIVTQTDVHIIDFKSNRQVPSRAQEVSEAYIHQLWVYRELLKQTYPTHCIKTSLLWTAAPKWMDIDHAQLDQYGQWALDSLAA